jgi:hypothetical protein
MPAAFPTITALMVRNHMTMSALDEHILKTAKEIVVKFIETGRISPGGFSEYFKSIYTTIDETVKEATEKKSKEAESDDDRIS